MNTKTAKALRKELSFHPKQTTEYVGNSQKSGPGGKDRLTGRKVKPDSFRGKYLAAKKAFQS